MPSVTLSAMDHIVVCCREKKNRPLKNPLKELVVVHTDKDFLADIEGDLHLCLTLSYCLSFITSPHRRCPLSICMAFL